MDKKTISTRGPAELAKWTEETFGNRNRGLVAMIWAVKAILEETSVSFTPAELEEIKPLVSDMALSQWAKPGVLAATCPKFKERFETMDAVQCFATMVKVNEK